MTRLPFTTSFPEVLVVNEEAFDSLPPDLQEALRDVSEEIERMAALAHANSVIEVLNVVEASGVEILELQDYDEALKILEEVWQAEWMARVGPRGEEIIAIAKDAVAKYRAFEVFPK